MDEDKSGQLISIKISIFQPRGVRSIRTRMDEAFNKLHEGSAERWGLVWFNTHEKLVTHLRQFGIPVDHFFVRYLCTLAVHLALESYQGESQT